eukprot:COSAG05_NODE_491_length_9309_cov_621.580726_3_plen_182_part_00
MGWFAPVEVKSRYLLAFCYPSIALALLYHFGTVVFAYFTGTCEGARACTTSIPVPYSPCTLPVPVFVAPVFVVRSPQHRRHWGREFSLHDLNAHSSFSLCRTEQVMQQQSGRGGRHAAATAAHTECPPAAGCASSAGTPPPHTHPPVYSPPLFTRPRPRRSRRIPPCWRSPPAISRPRAIR